MQNLFVNSKFIIPGEIDLIPQSMVDEFDKSLNVGSTALGLILGQCDRTEDGKYIRYSRMNVNFNRWRFLLRDLNSVHPSYIIDTTHEFYQSGRELSSDILDLLLNGSFQFVNDGAVIFYRTSISYNVVFVADSDARMFSIQSMRYIDRVAKHRSVKIEPPYNEVGFKVQSK